MASDHSIATGMSGRYAIALFELALEAQQLEQVETDLNGFEAALNESEDLRRLVRSPVFCADEQKNALSALLTKAQASEIVSNFFNLVVQNRRLFAVSNMIADFKALLSQHRGEVNAYVTSAIALSDQQMADLKVSLKDFAQKDFALGDVQVHTDVDPSLLGGLVVKIGSRMVDTSLRTKLNSLKIAMKEVG